MRLDRNFFITQKFTEDELKKYKQSAKRDLDIAKTSKDSEVTFHFSYMALVKIGIYCLAREGYRLKSRPGHHQKIIEYLSRHLNSENILMIGDKMRKDTLINFGFRLPSAIDNRPLTFKEFTERQSPTVYVSATPAQYEQEQAGKKIIEQIIRPTGLLEPSIEIKKTKETGRSPAPRRKN